MSSLSLMACSGPRRDVFSELYVAVVVGVIFVVVVSVCVGDIVNMGVGVNIADISIGVGIADISIGIGVVIDSRNQCRYRLPISVSVYWCRYRLPISVSSSVLVSLSVLSVLVSPKALNGSVVITVGVGVGYVSVFERRKMSA